jgi:hypothetical protein
MILYVVFTTSTAGFSLKLLFSPAKHHSTTPWDVEEEEIFMQLPAHLEEYLKEKKSFQKVLVKIQISIENQNCCCVIWKMDVNQKFVV